MRGLSTWLWASINERTVFIGYRWLAWALAGLLLVSQAVPPGQENRLLGLLMLTALINIGLTAWSTAYIRLVRRYPAVLILDLLFGLALIGASGGWRSPFQVYALSGLVLPALLGGWRSGILCAGLITAGNACLLLFGRTDLPKLPIEQAQSWLNLVTPVPLALLLPPVYQRARARSARHSTSSSSEMAPTSSTTLQDLRENIGASLPVASRQSALIPDQAIADAPAPAPLSVVRAAADHSHQELLRSVFGSAPTNNLAFDHALGNIVQSFDRWSGVRSNLTVTSLLPTLPPVVQGTLLRLAQEALLNVEQHAHATSVLVTLSCDQEQVSLSVQDDGVGLLDGTHERPGLHALRAVHYRLAEVGGKLAVQEVGSGGLCVSGTVPLISPDFDE